LLDAQGHTLLTSDGQSTLNPDDRIDVHVPAATDYLELENLGDAVSFTLTTSLTPSTTPFQPIPVGKNPTAVVAGDCSRDGHTDLAVANRSDSTVSVLLGNGDGTFQTQVTHAVGSGPDGLVVGDFNGDGRTDLAVVDSGTDESGPDLAEG